MKLIYLFKEYRELKEENRQLREKIRQLVLYPRRKTAREIREKVIDNKTRMALLDEATDFYFPDRSMPIQDDILGANDFDMEK